MSENEKELSFPSTLSNEQIEIKLKLFQRGSNFITNKQPEKALECFKEILQITPNDYSTWYNVGLAYALLQNNEEAISSYEKALNINPNYPRALRNKADIHCIREEYHLAIECMKKCIEIRPEDDDQDYVILGNAYRNVDPGLAKGCYMRATDINPDNFRAFNNIGTLLEKEGLVGEAGGCYERAIELYPNYFAALHNLATLYQENGNTEMANEFFERAAEVKNLKNDFDYTDDRELTRNITSKK